MAKRRALEADESALKKKVSEKGAQTANPEGDGALRSLKKRLRRTQRKRRRLAVRARSAAAKPVAAEGAAST